MYLSHPAVLARSTVHSLACPLSLPPPQPPQPPLPLQPPLPPLPPPPPPLLSLLALLLLLLLLLLQLLQPLQPLLDCTSYQPARTKPSGTVTGRQGCQLGRQDGL